MTDTTQEEQVQNATPAAAEAAPEQDDPTIVGELNEEEQAIFTNYRRNQSNGIQELGNLFYRGYKIAEALGIQAEEFQSFSKQLVESKGLNDDTMQYQLLGNGKIRGIKNPQATEAAAEAPAPSDEAEKPMSEADAKVAQLQAALEQAQAEASGTA